MPTQKITNLAKRFGPGQPAQSAQADLGGNILQIHYSPF